MEIIIEQDGEALADRAAQIVFAELERKPDLVLGLATGKTPIGLYRRLRAKPEPRSGSSTSTSSSASRRRIRPASTISSTSTCWIT
jgi:6-phosphogluconolactonase/glucosamine-6-phosphate isomerase/deaminase